MAKIDTGTLLAKISTPIEKYFDADRISIRAFNCCKFNDILTLGDLIKYHQTKGLQSVRNCGKKTAEELEALFEEVDLDIVTKIQENQNQSRFQNAGTKHNEKLDQYPVLPKPIKNLVESTYSKPLPGFSESCINQFFDSCRSPEELYSFLCLNQLELAERFRRIFNIDLQKYYYQLLISICDVLRNDPLAGFNYYGAFMVAKVILWFCDDWFSIEIEEQDLTIPIAKQAILADYEYRKKDLSVRAKNALKDKKPSYLEVLPLLNLSEVQLSDVLFPGRCMRKTNNELFLFFKDTKNALLKYKILDKKEINIKNIARNYPYLSEEQCVFVDGFRSQYGFSPMFFLLREYLSKSSKKSDVVFSMSTGINDGCCRTMDEIGKEFDLTRERIRQILNKASGSLFRDKEWKQYQIKEAGVITKDDDLYLNVINREKVNISFESFACVCSRGFPMKTIKENGVSFLVSNRFDKRIIDVICQEIKSLRSKKRTEEYVYQIDGALNGAPAGKRDDYRRVLSIIIEKAYGLVPDDEGNIVFPKNEIIIAEELYIILRDNGSPMSLAELFAELKQNYPTVKYHTSEQIRRVILSSDKIVAIGKTSTYALAEWNNVFKGNIRDLIVQILEDNEEPVHIDHLMQRVLLVYPNTSKRSVLSSMNNDRKRFVSFGEGYYGLVNKKYDAAIKKRKNERTSDEIANDSEFQYKCDQYLDFVKTYFYLPSVKTNRELFLWFKETRTNMTKLNKKEQKRFKKLLADLRLRGVCL